MKTPITYYGGKQRLAQFIINNMPPHNIYCEPFFGGGAVFFAKQPCFLEAINDTNDLLITFYRQCVDNFSNLHQRIQNTLDSQSEFKRAKYIWSHSQMFEPIDIAWAVWVCCNLSVMGTPDGGWKYDNGAYRGHQGRTVDHKRNAFTDAIYQRLRYVQISCRDALKEIILRDCDNTFFFVDPPYIGANQKHYNGYTVDNFQQLLDMLSDIEGKFMLTAYPCDILYDYIRRNSWHQLFYNSNLNLPNGARASKQKHEIIVTNYNTQPTLFDNI